MVGVDNMIDDYRLCKCLPCGNKYNQGTFRQYGNIQPHPHYTFWGDKCGEMVIINEPSTPLHWPLIKELVFDKWELEEE